MLAAQEETTNSEIFIARQPIFDRKLRLVAYELLYRDSEINRADIHDQNTSTSEVIISLLTDFGFDSLVGKYPAFINLSKDFLIGNKPLPLPAEHVVLEVLEDIVVDDALITGLKDLRDKGYTIALDDFTYTPEWKPVLPLVDYIKVEVKSLSQPEIKSHVSELKKHDIKLLAEKIESEEEYIFLHKCGFDYFQGYFLAKPRIVKGKTIPLSKLTLLKILADLNDEDIEIDSLVASISNDVSLCYKILRYINSAHFALERKVDSIHEAITYVGLKKLKHWASLFTLSSLNESSSELIQLSIIRAHMCEQIAISSGYTDTEVYFSAGLLSTLNALLGMHMPEILISLPLSETLRDALLKNKGSLGEALSCVHAYEKAEWEDAHYKSLDTFQIRQCYFEAVRLASESKLLQSAA